MSLRAYVAPVQIWSAVVADHVTIASNQNPRHHGHSAHRTFQNVMRSRIYRKSNGLLSDEANGKVSRCGDSSWTGDCSTDGGGAEVCAESKVAHFER
jgi:hypothetical protein